MDDAEDQRSLPQLLAEMTTELTTLLRKEVQLAKVETKEELTRAGKAGAMFGGAGFAGYMALFFLSFALAWWLGDLMSRALGFVIVGLIYGIVAAVLYFQGRKQMATVNPVPQQTVETLKEDVEWAKARKR